MALEFLKNEQNSSYELVSNKKKYGLCDKSVLILASFSLM